MKKSRREQERDDRKPITQGESVENDKQPKKYIGAVSVAEPGFMAETVCIDGEGIFFLCRDAEGYRLEPEIERPNDVVLSPPADAHGLIPKGVVLLPDLLPETVEACTCTQAELVAYIKQFIHRYADVPSFWLDLIAHYVLMTWVYLRFTAVPYLRFQGEPQTGKTRLLQVAGHLAYKAVFAGGATSSSPLFRLLDIWHGTFIIDEADYRSSDLWSEIIKILNSGYMRGLPVLRSEKDGDTYEPRAYDPFGPKMLSTRKPFDDYALETRCITLHTGEGPVRRDVPRQLPACFYDEALELRNKLLAWRFENYFQIHSDESQLLALEPRLTQIGTPLYSVSRDPEFQRSLLKFLGQHADEQRSERPQAVIVEAMRLLCDGRPATRLAIKDLALKALTIAQAWGVDVEFSPKRTGYLVRSLGFTPERSREGYMFKVQTVKLASLIEKYQQRAAR